MALRAAAATALLHAALIAATLSLTDDSGQRAPATPIEVRIVPAAEATAPPVLAPSMPASPPTPAPKASAGKQAQPRPRAEAKPITEKKPQQAIAEATPRAEAAPEPKASIPASSLAVAPAAPPAAAEPAAQAERSAPARTGASDAAYAASNRKPPYPRLSRSNDEQGTVTLRVLVKADGTAGQVAIKTSSGYPLLDKSASSTVQTWRFTPATVNGKPVDEWYEVPIPFKLVDD